MQIKIHPESLNKNGITGWALITILPHEERLKLYKSLSLKIVNGEVGQNEDPVETMLAMSKIARDHLIEAEIEFDGVKYDKEAIFMYEEFQGAISEIANACLKGLTLSKKL